MSQPISYTEELKRKAVHLSSLWMVALTLTLPRFYPGCGQWISCGVFAAGLLLTLVSEHSYANGGKYLGRLYGKLFGKMLRNEVKKGQWIVSGGAPVLAAALLVNLVFSPMIAAAALSVMLTGDAAAALIGRKLGRHPLVNGKSLEGTIGFIAVGFLISSAVLAIGSTAALPLSIYLVNLLAVTIAAIVELFTKQIRIDDNFTIPVAYGVVMATAIKFLF